MRKVNKRGRNEVRYCKCGGRTVKNEEEGMKRKEWGELYKYSMEKGKE